MSPKTFGSRSTCDEVVRGLDLSGRSMMVTGSNTGIGFEAARALASAGAHVFVACRNRESGEGAAARIRGAHPGAQVTPVVLDLASFASVRTCAETLPVDKLDVLICNAGLSLSRYATTADGIETTVGVCHFGHFLLVSLLLDKLRAAAPSRVVMVSSESHRYPAHLSFERFPLTERNYGPIVAYGQAKLCNVLFARELTRRYASQGVTANALHPGSFIGTSFFRDSLAARVLAAAAKPFTKTIAQGASTTVYCAVAPELERVGGRYYADCQEKKASRGARDDAAARRLWELSQERVGLPAEVRKSLDLQSNGA